MGIAGVNPRKIIVAQFSKICNTIFVKDTDGNYPDNSDEILPHANVRLGRCMAINRHCGLEIHRLPEVLERSSGR